MENAATRLVEDIISANAVNDTFVSVDHDDRDINIWLSRVSRKWVLEIDGSVIATHRDVAVVVNKLVDMKLI